MPKKGEVLKHTETSCTARTRDGDLCKNPPMLGARTCRMHGSATMAARAKAQDRINSAADSAARHLIEWMVNEKVPYNIRLAAARDLLDRAQVGTDKALRVDVDLDIRKFEQNLSDLLVDVVDGEIVEDIPVAPTPRALE